MVRQLTKSCVVGGNAVSAFLSWRLQATNSCDVTLVWKSCFEAVAQYGVSFRYVTRFIRMILSRALTLHHQVKDIWQRTF